MRLEEIKDELSAARTNKREFLNKLEAIIPWEEFIGIIKPGYYKGEVRNKPYPLELMLRIFILQNVYNLADMAVMNEVIDSRAFSDFCGINSPDEVPNGDTVGRFRNILTKNGLQEKIFAKVVEILTEQNLILKKGTIVDSTFIESPSSTKSEEKKCDPEARSGKKGNTWHYTKGGVFTFEKALFYYPSIESVCADSAYKKHFRNIFEEFHNLKVDISERMTFTFQVILKR